MLQQSASVAQKTARREVLMQFVEDIFRPTLVRGSNFFAHLCEVFAIFAVNSRRLRIVREESAKRRKGIDQAMEHGHCSVA
jgi:hypothetical protein